ncbi:fluoride efflux transporter CrcB [Agarilytica rhodophyticola]|uniref:fluoride efflux transporter CrcB n=1 Tax=Agarilytica rhodophyticola TaxID=1737490 RepID=UPI001FE968FB|nr:fluoride efflux transporter CrcB [Agarilytica rhodophyticola]
MHWLAVALGGSMGALCRYGLTLILPNTPGKLPLATFLANVVGSFLIGMFFVVIVEKSVLPAIWRQFAMVGFLGALTTFSSFSLESFQLLHSGHWKLALIYATSSVLACVFAAFGGYLIFNKLI